MYLIVNAVRTYDILDGINTLIIETLGFIFIPERSFIILVARFWDGRTVAYQRDHVL